MGLLTGKTAIVTGAGSLGPGWGNGKAAAVLFAREGAQVLACDLNEDAARETQAIIAAEGGACEVARVDVSKSRDVEEMVAFCCKKFGKIDVLHNNVGLYKTGGPENLEEVIWDQVMAVNLRSLYLTCRHVLPQMVKAGCGAIVNIGSIAGMRYMGAPTIAYSTSKGAVVSFTQAIAAQYGSSGIRVNCVVPGSIDTPVMRMSAPGGAASVSNEALAARASTIPLRRLGTGWDIAHASAFLASDNAAYITGAILMVDGGLSLPAPLPVKV